MAKRKTWVYRPSKTLTSKVPEDIKKALKARADELIESVIKPAYLKEPPENPQFNYLVDIYSKWYRHYFYFCTTYHCSGEHAISPSFEAKFARMEYLSNGHYNLSYMRHTGQWWQLYHDISMDDALYHIAEGHDFFP